MRTNDEGYYRPFQLPKWFRVTMAVVYAWCVLSLLAALLSGCSNSSTHGTEKDIKTSVTINNGQGGNVTINSPLSLESASETAQDTANTAAVTPTTRLQLTEGGSTAAGEASTLKDVASTLRQKLSSDNKTETNTETNSQTGAAPAATGGSGTNVDTGNGDSSTQPPTVINGTTGASAAILWKPVADNGGDLVVLLPHAMGNPVVSVLDMQGKEIEAGKFNGYSNPDRATYRFTRPGAKFPSPCILKVGGTMYLVKDATKYNESLPTYTPAAAATTPIAG